MKYSKFRKIKDENPKLRDEILEKVYSNPTIIGAEGLVNPGAIVSKARDILFANDEFGYRVDIALIRNLAGFPMAEIDMIEAVSSIASPSARARLRNLLGTLVPYCMKHTGDFVEQLREEMSFKVEDYDNLSLEIFFAFPSYLCSDYPHFVGFEKPLNYTERIIPLSKYHRKGNVH